MSNLISPEEVYEKMIILGASKELALKFAAAREAGLNTISLTPQELFWLIKHKMDLVKAGIVEDIKLNIKASEREK